MVAQHVVTALLTALTDNPRLTVLRREPIRIWQLSGVERLHLPDGARMVFKYANAPFTTEDRTLRHLAAHRIPVPHVHSSTIIENTLGMIMEDLGPPTRDANEHDAATAAARLHTLDPAPGLATLDETALRALPTRCLARLQQLGDKQPADTHDLAQLLHTLGSIAADRAGGAALEPFGTCHSELHPTSLHITDHGWHLLDVAKAFNGPGILDLATWYGTRNPPNPPRLRRLLTRYVEAGGHPHALTDRAGLPAETWALAWHRTWAAETLLNQAAIAGHLSDTGPAPGIIDAVRRQAATAFELFHGKRGSGIFP